MKIFRPTKIEAAAFISYLSHLNFKLLVLQCFGHIQSKNKDAKSALSCFFVFLIKKCDGLSPTIWRLWRQKGRISCFLIEKYWHTLQKKKKKKFFLKPGTGRQNSGMPCPAIARTMLYYYIYI